MPVQPLRSLNERHKKFIQLYIAYNDGARAAREAGFSQKWASRIAYHLLDDPRVQEELRKQRDKWSLRTDVTVERIIKERARLAFFNVKDCYDDQGNLKSIKDISEDDTACVSEVRETIGEGYSTTQLKFHDKKGALDALAKQLGLDKNELDLNIHEVTRLPSKAASREEWQAQHRNGSAVIHEAQDGHPD